MMKNDYKYTHKALIILSKHVIMVFTRLGAGHEYVIKCKMINLIAPDLGYYTLIFVFFFRNEN